MASTRNRNTPGNYAVEQQEYERFRTYSLYPQSQYGAACTTQWPGQGLLPGQIPGNQLSHNTADIESFLFGINATNLVIPAVPVTPHLATLTSANVFLAPHTVDMPDPLVQLRGQRPFPI